MHKNRMQSTRKGMGKIVMPLALSAMMALTVAVEIPAFALNYNGSGGGSGGGTGNGNKAMNFYGYSYDYTDPDILKVYFDKTVNSSGATAGQFIIKEHNSPYTQVSVSSVSFQSGTGYSGCNDSGLTVGTTVTLDLADDLDPDTLYDITLAPTIAAANGITLGNYRNRDDFTFALKTPDGSGDYSGTPAITYWPGDNATGVPYEGNILMVLDRPMDSGDVSTVLDDLESNFYNNTLSATVVQDDTIDGTPASGAECYTPHANDANTALFFPLVVSSSSNAVANLENSGSNTYTLPIPSFDDVSLNSFSGDTLNFSTVSADISGWLDNTPTVDSATSNSLTVHWQEGTITPVADDTSEFDVYYSTQQFGFESNWTKVTSPTITESPAGTFNCTVSGLSSSTTYYFRIVPKNANGEAGFSVAGSGTTTS